MGKADRTPVYFDAPLAYAVDEKGTKEDSVGQVRGRADIVLPSFRWTRACIVFERKTLLTGDPKKGVVQVHKRGYVTSGLVERWVRLVRQCRPGASCARDFWTRTAGTSQTLSRLSEGETVIIPGGATSQLRLLEVATKDATRVELA